MNQHTYSTALAETHRADLMAAADRDRRYRQARPQRHRNWPPRLFRLPRPTSFAFTRHPAQLRNAT
jgi:hypothetical protein